LLCSYQFLNLNTFVIALHYFLIHLQMSKHLDDAIQTNLDDINILSLVHTMPKARI
jgi:hypothetical protein